VKRRRRASERVWIDKAKRDKKKVQRDKSAEG